MRRHRELVREERAYAKEAGRQAKEAAREQAKADVDEYENYLAMLVSVHQDCGDQWNWNAVAAEPRPPEPGRSSNQEAQARAALDAYHPGFFEKLFGGAKHKRATLEAGVHSARTMDAQQFEQATAEHGRRCEGWEFRQRLAARVPQLELDACQTALRYVGAFDELEEFSTRVIVESVADKVALVTCTIEDAEIVPDEELKLTAGGKVASKAMAAGKHWALYQDHVCSCAIRIGREIFATVPVSRTIVNIRAVRVDSSTGHAGPQAILAVHFTRPKLLELNLRAIDPSDSMKNFPHRMKFKKTAGFDRIEEMTTDEQWVTT